MRLARRRVLLYVGCVWLGLGVVSGCSKGGEPAASGQQTSAPASAGTEKNQQLIQLHPKSLKHIRFTFATVSMTKQTPFRIQTMGQVRLPPSGVSRVGSRVGGRIIRLFVKVGQQVRKGKALALIDSPSVGRARADLLKALSLHRLAKTEYKRTSRMKKVGLVSAKAVFAARMEAERARIRVQAAQAQLRVLGVSTRLGKTHRSLTGYFVLPAPATGEVTLIDKTVGAWVSPQDTLFRIEQRRRVVVVLDVFSDDLSQVKVGQQVLLRVPGLPRPLSSTIARLSSRFEGKARTLHALVPIDNPGGQLRVNQRVQADIVATRASSPKPAVRGALLIPEDAVQQVERGTVVFVVGSKAGSFRVRSVVVVPSIAGKVRVLRGLRQGDKIVVDGSFLLKSELMRSALDGD